MSTLSLWTRRPAAVFGARDPFAEFDRTFDAIVRRTFGTASAPPAAFVPAAEVVREGDDAVVRLEVPGLDVTKDVAVELEAGRLSIRGEKRDERTEDQRGHRVREVRYGSFERSFAVPEHLDAEAVSASYDAGVLTVRVAGLYAQPEARAKRIAVTSGAPAGIEPTASVDEHPTA